MLLSRRKFVLTGLVAAPAVVAIDSLMPIKMYKPRIWKYLAEGETGRDYEDGNLYQRVNGILRPNLIVKNDNAPRALWKQDGCDPLKDFTFLRLAGGDTIHTAAGHIFL